MLGAAVDTLCSVPGGGPSRDFRGIWPMFSPDGGIPGLALLSGFRENPAFLGSSHGVLGAMNRILAIFIFVFAAIAGSPLKAADIPDRLPDDYTDDGRPVWYPILDPKPIPQWEYEFGARYFPSSGKTKINLLDPFTGGLVSRLTFSNLTAHSGELFGKVEHLSGLFFKGYVGGGAVTGGKLQDEDFLPPFLGLYSSTDSQQRDGQLRYGTIDAGYEWRSESLRLGFFGGYFYYSERLNAFGCTQTATNLGVCVPTVASSVNIISESTTWNAMRLGGNTTWIFGNGLSLITELAWLPYANLSGADFHWLRPDLIRPVPETSIAVLNVQLEALLNYQFSPNFAAGLGARYWRIGSDGKSGEAAFPSVQAINFRTERYGGFVQLSYKFGDLRPSRY